MSIIIGGCGSTGTSMLRQVLNRHSKVYIAPETHVFAKNRLYRDWDSYRSNISRRSVFGLRSSGMTMFTGFDLKQQDFAEVKKQLEQLAQSSKTFSDFAAALFEPVMRQHSKTIWGEKTPNNIYHFRDIASKVKDVTCLWMIRNPYDTIASLVSRGYSIGYAVARCLMSYSFGVAAKRLPNVEIVRYEELVVDPKSTLSDLCKTLGLQFEDAMLASGKASPEESTQMTGWNLDESDQIQANSIGRFQKLPQETHNQILQACHELKIKEEVASKLNLESATIKAICKRLKYDYLGRGELRGKPRWIDRELSRVKLSRSLRGYPQPFRNFPVILR